MIVQSLVVETWVLMWLGPLAASNGGQNSRTWWRIHSILSLGNIVSTNETVWLDKNLHWGSTERKKILDHLLWCCCWGCAMGSQEDPELCNPMDNLHRSCFGNLACNQRNTLAGKKWNGNPLTRNKKFSVLGRTIFWK